MLELLVPDESGKLQVECTTDVFGHIRDLMPFRLPGSKQDFIVLATDSGRLDIDMMHRLLTSCCTGNEHCDASHGFLPVKNRMIM